VTAGSLDSFKKKNKQATTAVKPKGANHYDFATVPDISYDTVSTLSISKISVRIDSDSTGMGESRLQISARDCGMAAAC
jgi:hypothetical protein